MPAAKKKTTKTKNVKKAPKAKKTVAKKAPKKVVEKKIQIKTEAKLQTKPKTKLAPLFLAIVIGILIILGHLTYSYYHPADKPVPTNVNSAKAWQTYSSQKANYSFKYPVEWPLAKAPSYVDCKECVEDLEFTPKYDANSWDNTIAIISVFSDARIATLDDYKNVFIVGDDTKTDVRDAMVGSEKAISYKLSGGTFPLPIIEYVVVKNGMAYEIRLEDSIETNKNKAKNVELFNTMLSTFKFN